MKVSQIRVKYGKAKKGHGAVWWGEGNDWLSHVKA